MAAKKSRLLAQFCVAGGMAASVPAFAQSTVTLYGLADAMVGVSKSPGAQAAAVQQGGGMSTSFWGLRGSENLGGGYSTFFVLESYFQPNNGTYGRFSGDSFFSRNAYVGIKTPYGSLAAGRLTTPMYLATIAGNPFFNSYTFSPWIFHTYKGLGTEGVVGDSAWNNAVSYSAPTWHGLGGTVIYAFGNTAGDAGAHKWGVTLNYAQGPLTFAANYQYINFSSTPGDIGTALTAMPGLRSQTTAQFDLAYNFHIAKVFAGYMNIRDTNVLGVASNNTWQIGASVPVGLGAFLADYVFTKSSGAESDDDLRSTWAVGYDYPLSKRTDLYAGFKSDRFTNESTGLTYGAGIRHVF